MGYGATCAPRQWGVEREKEDAGEVGECRGPHKSEKGRMIKCDTWSGMGFDYGDHDSLERVLRRSGTRGIAVRCTELISQRVKQSGCIAVCCMLLVLSIRKVILLLR